MNEKVEIYFNALFLVEKRRAEITVIKIRGVVALRSLILQTSALMQCSCGDLQNHYVAVVIVVVDIKLES